MLIIPGEEMEESCSCSTLLHDGDTCPICLNCLLEQEIGFPENCSHTFCMTCILKWAEVRLGSKVCVFLLLSCIVSNSYRFLFYLRKKATLSNSIQKCLNDQLINRSVGNFLLNVMQYFVFGFYWASCLINGLGI